MTGQNHGKVPDKVTERRDRFESAGPVAYKAPRALKADVPFLCRACWRCAPRPDAEPLQVVALLTCLACGATYRLGAAVDGDEERPRQGGQPDRDGRGRRVVE